MSWQVVLGPHPESQHWTAYAVVNRHSGPAEPSSVEWSLKIGTTGVAPVEVRQGTLLLASLQNEATTYHQSGSWDFLRRADYDLLKMALVHPESRSLEVLAEFKLKSVQGRAAHTKAMPSGGRAAPRAARKQSASKKPKHPVASSSLKVKLPTGATVAVRNDKQGWWLALLCEPIIDKRRPVTVQWYEPRGKGFALTKLRESIPARSVHLDSIGMQKCAKRPAIWQLQDSGAIEKIGRMY